MGPGSFHLALQTKSQCLTLTAQACCGRAGIAKSSFSSKRDYFKYKGNKDMQKYSHIAQKNLQEQI